MLELIFEIRDAEVGGYYARALGMPYSRNPDTWETLRANVLEATDPVLPRLVQLHYVRDELPTVTLSRPVYFTELFLTLLVCGPSHWNGLERQRTGKIGLFRQGFALDWTPPAMERSTNLN